MDALPYLVVTQSHAARNQTGDDIVSLEPGSIRSTTPVAAWIQDRCVLDLRAAHCGTRLFNARIEYKVYLKHQDQFRYEAPIHKSDSDLGMPRFRTKINHREDILQST